MGSNEIKQYPFLNLQSNNKNNPYNNSEQLSYKKQPVTTGCFLPFLACYGNLEVGAVILSFLYNLATISCAGYAGT